MIRTITLLFAALCLVSVARSRPPPPFPIVFSALINETELGSDRPVSVIHQVFFDAPNKRARHSYENYNGVKEDWSLVYRPSGADPSNPNAKGYTLFDVNPAFFHVPGDCWYSQSYCNLQCQLPPAFPYHWAKLGSSDIDMSAWFDMPDDMVYNGTYFIEELNVLSDRWDSRSTCTLWAPIGDVPCTSVMFSRGPNPLPLMELRATLAANTYDGKDSYKVSVYHSIKTSVQDSDFALPNNWETKCTNIDNKLEIRMEVLVHPDHQGVISIRLETPPVRSLGPVTISISVDPTPLLSCENCLKDLKQSLTFTRDNWNVPQKVSLTYAESGCSQLLIAAKGGGYGFVFAPIHIPVLTCGLEEQCDFGSFCSSA